MTDVSAELSEAIFSFFDNNLIPGMCYHGSLPTGKPFIRDEDMNRLGLNNNELIYQDGTACSASHAFSDIYKKKDGTYIVVTDTGAAEYQGHSYESSYQIENCETLFDVLLELLSFCGHDPNSSGDMFYHVFNKFVDDLTPDECVRMIKEDPTKWVLIKNYKAIRWDKDNIGVECSLNEDELNENL